MSWLLAGCMMTLAGLTVMTNRFLPGRRGGFATTRDLTKALGKRQLKRRGHVLRPSVVAPSACDLGLPLGNGRRRLYGSIEDSYLLLGPPRVGKGAGAIIPWLLTYPGPAIVTSTRDDLLRATLTARQQMGPAWLFDPTQTVSAAALAKVLRSGWNVIDGCREKLTAILRARAFVLASKSSDGIRNADFWRGSSELILRCFFHAAAMGSRDVRAVHQWVGTMNTTEPIALLKGADPHNQWISDLVGIAQLDHETRTNVFAGVQMALSAFADPRILDACSSSGTFDVDTFLRSNGTLYLVGTSDAQHSMAPVIVALVEAIAEAARRRAAQSPHGRLDPPLGLFLDEAAQIAPLPSLPRLISDGGGSGITPIVVLQSMAQARDRWGQQAADTIWDSSTVRLVFGGIANDIDLQRISRLCGEVDERVVTHHVSGPSTSNRKRAVMAPAQIRGLKPWHVLLLYKGLAPSILKLRPHFAKRRRRGRKEQVELIGRLTAKTKAKEVAAGDRHSH